MLFLTNINLNKNELQNAVIQNLTADPSNPRTGQVYYNTTDLVLKQFNGTTWDVVGKELNPATYSALGGVIVDSDTLTVSGTGLLAVKTPTDNNFSNTLKDKLDDIEANADVNVIETINVNGTSLTPSSKVVNIYTINAAAFADDSTATPASPVKMTLTDGNNQTVTANIPKVSSTSAGVVPKGTAVATQSQTTKFLREDGTWAAPSYTEDPSGTYLPLTGGTMSGAIAMATGSGTNAITNVADPSNDQDAATKKYVDDSISNLSVPMVMKGSIGTGGTLDWANLPAAAQSTEGNTYRVITDHLTAPICEVGDLIVCCDTSLTSTPNYEWVVIPSGDEPGGSVLSVSVASPLTTDVTGGGPIVESGTIRFANQQKNKVLAGPDGSTGNTADAAPTFRSLVLADIPDLSSLYLKLSGGTMSGNIAMDSNNITGLADPSNDQDAATKKYVDDAVSTATGGAVLKITVTNPVLTAAGGAWTWTIPAATNTLGANVIVTVYEVATGEVIIPDISVNQSSGAITIVINDTANLSTLATGTYKAVILG